MGLAAAMVSEAEPFVVAGLIFIYNNLKYYIYIYYLYDIKEAVGLAAAMVSEAEPFVVAGSIFIIII